MNGITLTPEQREYAAEHHNLIFAFLNKKHLCHDEFYDIIVFGYLLAVKQYLSEPALERYSFTTIAWRKMNDCLAKHYRTLGRQQRYGRSLSLDSFLHNEESLSLEAVIPSPDPLMMKLETELLFHELASRVSKRQMSVIRLKASGYKDREIARKQKTTVNDIRNLLASVHETVLSVCES